MFVNKSTHTYKHAYMFVNKSTHNHIFDKYRQPFLVTISLMLTKLA